MNGPRQPTRLERRFCNSSILPLLILTLPSAVEAQFSYTNNNSTTITITGYSGPGGAVTIPSSINGLTVVSIGIRAFSRTALTSVTIPASVTTLRDAAFLSCASLANVTIGSGVTSIGNSTFASCTSLTNITIPNNVTGLGYEAFYNCTSLTNITIGSGVTSIGDMMVNGCLHLTTITVDALNPAYSSADGVLFDKSQTTLVLYPPGRVGSYTIPDSVTNIADYAFYDANLTGVKVGIGVINIGVEAFYACWHMTNATIGGSSGDNASVLSIGDNAFLSCANLADLTLGNGVTSIGGGAFYSCTSLTNVAIPDSVISIGNTAFFGCSSLTNVTIGTGLASFGDSVFTYCNRLIAITVDDFNPSFSSVNGVLFDKNQNTLIQYPPGKGGNYTIPNGVAFILEYAFYACTDLTGVMIPGTVTNIGYAAFYNCTGLTGVIIPNSVTILKGQAFNACSGLTSVSIPGSVNYIEPLVFAYCTSLTNVTIGSGLPYLGNSMFAFCSNLARVTIPNSVTSIEGAAFEYCSSLTSVTIPASVTSLGAYAFYGCTNLTSALFMGNAPSGSGDSTVFGQDPNATVYYLPGTTGWGSTFGGRPALLWNPQAQTSDPTFGVRTNRFGFTITGASGLVVVIEASTSLVRPVWVPVATNTLTGGSSYYSDANWTNFKARFYRLRFP